MTDSPIPIVIGVTGHRDLRTEELASIRALVRRQLKDWMAQYPHSCFWMLNSLAAGADLLCGEIARELGIRLICPLPMDREDYAKDFTDAQRQQFLCLLSQAESFVCPPVEPEQPGRDYRYRQAGLYVASHCHILLALWDGDEAKKNGCGTAAAVYSAREGRPYAAFPCAGAVSVFHVQVNRASSSQSLPVCGRWLTENREVLSCTDCFNADAAKGMPDPGYSLLPEECLEEAPLRRLEQLFRRADGLSVAFQKRHTRSLLVAAVCCVTLVVAYLMYDELDCRSFLILYGIVMAVYGLGCRLIGGLGFLRRYLQYRLLAETARVQCCVSALGYRNVTTDCFTWTQKQDAAWVHCAVSAVCIGFRGEPVLSEEQIRQIWIRDQQAYHTRAGRKTEHQHRLNQRICRCTLLGMVAAFVLTFVLEYGFPGFMTGSAFLGLSPQSWMKILWGMISAVTLFATDYFGKLCLERKQIDHGKMAALFRSADRAFEQFPGSRETLFQRLATEELTENGNWYSYSQESTLSFDL